MARKPVTVTWTKVAALGRRRLNPYTGEFMQIGDPYILDANKAYMLADMGEVEILEEDVTPPWAVKVEPVKPAAPAPAAKESVK